VNEQRGEAEFFLLVVAAFVTLLMIGTASAARRDICQRFERHGYVLINGESGEAVATVTPIFEEWRR